LISDSGILISDSRISISDPGISISDSVDQNLVVDYITPLTSHTTLSKGSKGPLQIRYRDVKKLEGNLSKIKIRLAKKSTMGGSDGFKQES
jgi:hypothetical protein